MIKTYIAADTQFFNRAAAKTQHLSVDKYNQMVINKINETVSAEDYVILNGDISFGNEDETEEILNKIKAKTTILKRNGMALFTAIKNRRISLCHLNIDIPANINNKESHVIILADSEKHLNNYLNTPNTYIAVASSIINQNEIYKRPYLNISLKNWDFIPIEIGERLPQIIDDYELFSSMEDIKEEIME